MLGSVVMGITKRATKPSPREAAAPVFAARIRSALGHAQAPFAAEVVDAMAARLAESVEAVLDLYVVPARTRSAVSARLAVHWWLSDLVDGALRERAVGFDVAAEVDAMRAVAVAPRMAWPLNVTLAELASVYERSRDDRAKTIAAGIRAGAWSIVDPPGAEERVPYAGQHVTIEGRVAHAEGAAEHDASEPALRFRTAALIAWAEKSIREEQERARAFAMPSTLPARAASFAISNGGRKGGGAWKGKGTIEPGERPPERRVFLRVAWGGRYALPVQLSLSFMGDPAVEVVRAVLNELRDDGLRDWLTLHRMAAEQGRSGRFVWTWEEHKRATAYDARIRYGNVTDREARNAVMSRLWALNGAALWLERENDAGTIERVLVGEEAFLTIVAERDDAGGDVEAAQIRINPVLYEGAHREAKNKHFVPIPEAVLRLDGPALRLAAMLAFEVRWARDQSGVVELSESSLHLLAGTYGDGHPDRQELTHARRTLHNALANALDALGSGASFDYADGPTGKRYTIRPPQWMARRAGASGAAVTPGDEAPFAPAHGHTTRRVARGEGLDATARREASGGVFAHRHPRRERLRGDAPAVATAKSWEARKRRFGRVIGCDRFQYLLMQQVTDFSAYPCKRPEKHLGFRRSRVSSLEVFSRGYL